MELQVILADPDLYLDELAEIDSKYGNTQTTFFFPWYQSLEDPRLLLEDNHGLLHQNLPIHIPTTMGPLHARPQDLRTDGEA